MAHRPDHASWWRRFHGLSELKSVRSEKIQKLKEVVNRELEGKLQPMKHRGGNSY